MSFPILSGGGGVGRLGRRPWEAVWRQGWVHTTHQPRLRWLWLWLRDHPAGPAQRGLLGAGLSRGFFAGLGGLLPEGEAELPSRAVLVDPPTKVPWET